ncbi:MAG: 50S ribosomal protein L35 [Anaerolineales bacterium]|nr:50S ribosomal protein L35 [Anaerolineales bacterium]
MARKSKKRGKSKKKTPKYKLKTHKATAKRFRMTGSGKIVRTKGRQGHFRRRKSKRAKRQFTRMLSVSAAGHRKTIRRLAPYLNKYATKGN